MKLSPFALGGLGLLYALHNDFWLWSEARSVLGLPAGLVYHALFCLAVSIFMWFVTGRADLDSDLDESS